MVIAMDTDNRVVCLTSVSVCEAGTFRAVGGGYFELTVREIFYYFQLMNGFR